MLTVIGCDYDQVGISCGVGNGLTIEIVRATWGKSDNRVCPGKKENRGCAGKNYRLKVAAR